MRVHDEIDLDLRTFSYRNIGASRHHGVEASGELTLARVRPFATYAWTHVEDEENPGQQLKNIPEHVVQLLLHLGELLFVAGVVALVHQRALQASLRVGPPLSIDVLQRGRVELAALGVGADLLLGLLLGRELRLRLGSLHLLHLKWLALHDSHHNRRETILIACGIPHDFADHRHVGILDAPAKRIHHQL